MKSYYIVLLLCIVALSGCEDEQPVYETKFLLPGQWQLTGWYDDEARDINNDGKSSVDLYSQWNGCEKNGIIDFRTNNIFEFVNQNNTNNPDCTVLQTNDNAITGWEIIDDSTIMLTGSRTNKKYKIINLEDELLVIKGADIIISTSDTPSQYTGGYLRFARYSSVGNK